jgi:hypothetical protein
VVQPVFWLQCLYAQGTSIAGGGVEMWWNHIVNSLACLGGADVFSRGVPPAHTQSYNILDESSLQRRVPRPLAPIPSCLASRYSTVSPSASPYPFTLCAASTRCRVASNRSIYPRPKDHPCSFAPHSSFLIPYCLPGTAQNLISPSISVDVFAVESLSSRGPLPHTHDVALAL